MDYPSAFLFPIADQSPPYFLPFPLVVQPNLCYDRFIIKHWGDCHDWHRAEASCQAICGGPAYNVGIDTITLWKNKQSCRRLNSSILHVMPKTPNWSRGFSLLGRVENALSFIYLIQPNPFKKNLKNIWRGILLYNTPVASLQCVFLRTPCPYCLN
jgi:hypothetical protein